ncbi:MAG: hypothetical protein PHW72_01180 [Candidatus Pacebacteria bacterium]|nr:hypothetical protein [Candidatus Paceibacterota bacterium]
MKIEYTPHERFLLAILNREDQVGEVLFYSHITDAEKTKTLEEAMAEIFDHLQFLNEKEKRQWRRWWKILDLRFGLSEGKQRTFKDIGQCPEFSVTVEAIRGSYLKAIRALRSYRYSDPNLFKTLEEFLILPHVEAKTLRDQCQNEKKNLRARLSLLMERQGLTEKDLEGLSREVIAEESGKLKIQNKKKKILEELGYLAEKFPNKRVWNKINHHFTTFLDDKDSEKMGSMVEYLTMIKKGIFSVKGLGTEGIKFLDDVLWQFDQKAPP